MNRRPSCDPPPIQTDSATAELMTSVYEDLRRLAHRWFNDQPAGHTLAPTALVHEAYLRLARSGRPHDRSHALALAATAMRQILISHARGKKRIKRGGSWQRVSLAPIATEDGELDFEVLYEALERLEKLNPRQARIVDLRYFGGLTIEECARALSISARTVKVDWQMARAWLHGEIERAEK
ncbi:MAG: ECF-type sigma factor [Planctomycetota bacterium]